MLTSAAISALLAIALAVLLLVGREAYLRSRDDVLFPAPGRLIDVGGRKLHLVTMGEGAPVVVLIAGGGGPAVTVWPLQRLIAAFARAVSYDRAGLGWSEPAAGPLTFDQHAQDLHALLAAAGERGPYVLVAASLGGAIARCFATLFPGDVAGMVLVDSVEEQQVFAKMDRLSAGLRRQMALVRLVRGIGLLRFVVRREARKYAPDDDARAFAAIHSRPSYVRAIEREVQAYRLTPQERRVAGGFGGLGDLPLTVIDHDKPFPDPVIEEGWHDAQARLAALSSRGRLVVATGYGHNIAGEAPALVAEEVRSMLETLKP